MYSTEFGDLAHKEQIKDGWRRSNKNDEGRQIVHSYSGQHGIQMTFLNVESLRRHGADLSAAVLHYLESTPSAVTALWSVGGSCKGVGTPCQMSWILVSCRGLTGEDMSPIDPI